MSTKKSGFQKGHIPWSKGKKRPEISGENHPRYWLGKKHPPSKETREKRRKALLGKPRPQWVINKIIKNSPTGVKHHNWKGGITPLREKIWHRKEYYQWRKSIFEKDNYICVICNKKSGFLHADHYPISFSKIIKDFKIKSIQDARNCKKLWDINNGRTLCISCHRKTENYGK